MLKVTPSKDAWLVGVDEVGAGCLAGPLVAAAFAYRLRSPWVGLEALPVRVIDSKLLSEKKRGEAEEWLKSAPDSRYRIVEITPTRIDELNIYHARMEALSKAATLLSDTLEGSPLQLLIDGPIIPAGIQKTSSRFENVQAVSKGDRKFFAIAAASIIAKNYRDRLMAALGEEHPQYAWHSNVGYPTAEHKSAIKEHGPTDWHRRSFRWA